MTITNKELDNSAKLAYLDIASDDNAKLGEDVNAIMNFVEQLRKIDTKGIAPLFHPFDLHQRFRADEVSEEDCSAQLAAIAPFFEEELYVVPPVIDSGQ